jgi:ribosomal protein S18 acetylase RimI-like enzyme
VRSGEFGLEHPTGWIEVLGVDPDARGKAIGRRMAEAMLDHFRELGATEVRTLVDTEQMGDIAGFFRSLGFEPAPLVPLVRQL